MKSQVCVIGSFNVDIISYLPRLPTIGESLLASNFIFSPGGKGCNQAQMCIRDRLGRRWDKYSPSIAPYSNYHILQYQRTVHEAVSYTHLDVYKRQAP